MTNTRYDHLKAADARYRNLTARSEAARARRLERTQNAKSRGAQMAYDLLKSATGMTETNDKSPLDADILRACLAM